MKISVKGLVTLSFITLSVLLFLTSLPNLHFNHVYAQTQNVTLSGSPTSLPILTYENFILGIHLHYPSNWQYNNGNTNVTLGPSRDQIGILSIAGPTMGLNISIEERARILINNQKINNTDYHLDESRSTTIHGNPAYVWTHIQKFSNGTVSKGINVVVEDPKNPNKSWFISFGPESLSTYNSLLPDVRNIINSLELISSSSSSLPFTNTIQGAFMALANNNNNTNTNKGSTNQDNLFHFSSTERAANISNSTGNITQQLSLTNPVNLTISGENQNPRISVGENGNIYVVWENFTGDQILFSKSTDDGNTFSKPILVNTGGRGNEPQISASGNNVYILWEKRYNMIGFSKSTDDGATFNNETTWGNESSSDISKAQLAVFDNNVYILMYGSDSHPHPLLFMRSTDAGSHFDKPVKVSTNVTVDSTNFPQIALSNNGNIIVAWYSGDKILTKRSTDHGTTFNNNVVTLFTRGSCTSDLKISYSLNNIHAVCIMEGHEKREGEVPGTHYILDYKILLYVKSSDNGDTFSDPVSLTDKEHSDVDNAPFIFSNENDVYIAFDNYGGSKNYKDIYFARSSDSGNTFHNPLNVSNETKESAISNMKVIGNNIYITWNNENNARPLIFAASTSGGTIFGHPMNLSKSNSYSSQPDLAVYHKKAYAVWRSGHDTTRAVIQFAAITQNCNMNCMNQEMGNNSNQVNNKKTVELYSKQNAMTSVTENTSTPKLPTQCNGYNSTCAPILSSKPSSPSNSSIGSVNHELVVNVVPNQTVNENSTVVLLGIASDLDPNSKISYLWKQIAGPLVTLKGNDTATPTFIAPATASSDTDLKFALTAKDDKGAESINPAIVTIKVKHANLSPSQTNNNNNNFTSINDTINSLHISPGQQQLNPTNKVNGFVAIYLKGAGLTLQIPKNWFEKKFDGKSISFCSDSDCHSANMTIDVQTFNPTPGSYFSSVNDLPQNVFNGVLYSERLSGLQILQIHPLGYNHQDVLFSFHDPVSGQDAVGLGVHLIGNGHLYVIHFVATKETWNAFMPVIVYITSTWHYNIR